MYGDGNHQFPLNLIGRGKDNTSYCLGHGKGSIYHVGKDKDQCAQRNSHHHTPASKKAIDNSPEKNFLCYRRYQAANKEEVKQILCPIRESNLNKSKGVYAGNV